MYAVEFEWEPTLLVRLRGDCFTLRAIIRSNPKDEHESTQWQNVCLLGCALLFRWAHRKLDGAGNKSNADRCVQSGKGSALKLRRDVRVTTRANSRGIEPTVTRCNSWWYVARYDRSQRKTPSDEHSIMHAVWQGPGLVACRAVLNGIRR